MKTSSVLFIMFLCLFSFSCDPLVGGKWGLRLANDSDKKVYFTVSFYYLNSTWNQVGPLRPAEAHSKGDLELDWKSVNAHLPDSLAVLVFDPDTLAKYTLAEIECNQNYLKIFKMKYADVPGGSQTLHYPSGNVTN